jgi:hypothetical protein
MSTTQIWETRPLEFWEKAKELRAGWQNSIESTETVIAQGNTFGTMNCDWSAAFPALSLIEDNPVGSMMEKKNEPFARKARLACEIRGWGREICGYQGNCWGAQFLGCQEDGAPFPKRKLVVPMPATCDQHTKRGAQVRDFENVPQWSGDKFVYIGPFDEKRNGPMLEHRVYCNLKIVNDIERIFGQRFQDGKLAALMGASDDIVGFNKEITLLMARTIPSPLSVKDLYSIFTLGGLTRIDPDVAVSFWKMVRDEVKWRAENQIAAVGNERFRWIEAHPPSWHYMKYYRYMEQEYGAVCLGSEYVHGYAANMELNLDGSISSGETMVYPSDTPITTREDAVRYATGPDARIPDTGAAGEVLYRDPIVKFAKVMQADGALLPVWRSGHGCTMMRKEHGMYLKEAGLSVIHYEGSQPGDRTDLDEKRLLDQLDAWMQGLGFRKFGH